MGGVYCLKPRLEFKMKLFIMFALALSLSGCGMLQRMWTHWTNEVTFKCVKGITFVQSDSGLAWLPDENGKPVPCKE